MRLGVLLAIFLLSHSVVAAPPGAVLLDALVARVGHEAITLQDLNRYRDVHDVMACAKLREGTPKKSLHTRDLLDRYVEEELLVLEARGKKMNSGGGLSRAVERILAKPDCKKDWLTLGKSYGRAWNTGARPREGEGQLVRELEKRLLVDRFLEVENLGERATWFHEARLKHPVKLYLE